MWPGEPYSPGTTWKGGMSFALFSKIENSLILSYTGGHVLGLPRSF